VDEDVGLVEVALHVGGVGDEVGREVALVELHALDELDLGLEALALFDGDDAVLADLVHGGGDDLADLSSWLAEQVPTWAISLEPVTGVAHGVELARRWRRRPCRCRA
jgi:hypothetical protein